MALLGGFIKKIKDITNKWSHGVSNLFSDKPITEEFWEDLEEQLIFADVGVETSLKLLDELKKIAIERCITHTGELKIAFAELLIQKLESVPLMGEGLVFNGEPSVFLLVGVNGSGKTTTAGKLAAQYKKQGISVILAAADTFRAAAIDQLKAWGAKVGVRVVAQNPGSDSAAVVYDSILSARSSGTQAVIADTAGRLHTKSNLMDELSKVNRVVSRELASDPAEIILVLDSVTGQNGFLQAEAFNKTLKLTGVILTKFDNTAKGGIILSIADKLHLPIRYVGMGEGVDDLVPFDPRSYVRALLDIEGVANEE